MACDVLVNGEITGFHRGRNRRDHGGILRGHMASACIAKPVIDAGGTAPIRARINRARSAMRMQTGLARCVHHHVDEVATAQRRHGIFALARAFENIARLIDLALQIAGLARHADFVLDRVEVRLQFLVGQRPVFDSRALRNRVRAIAAHGLASRTLKSPRRGSASYWRPSGWTCRPPRSSSEEP